MLVLCLFAFIVCAFAHDMDLPVSSLGVPGFPDCVRKQPGLKLSVEEADADLVCSQRAKFADSIKIGCIGDSITAGAHSSGGNHTYPGQLQIMLDQQYGVGKYEVTNLGACGSTLLTRSDSPYWTRAQYIGFMTSQFDIVTIMLGTNDAKDPGSKGPNNWQHDCGNGIEGCSYAGDFAELLGVVRQRGTSGRPKIYAMIPPPLMMDTVYGMNQTVINTVLPDIIPEIAKAHNLDGLIDVYSGMGGVKDWSSKFPSSCTKDDHAAYPLCEYWCDDQSCDQCHPNDVGYNHLASVIKAGLGL